MSRPNDGVADQDGFADLGRDHTAISSGAWRAAILYIVAGAMLLRFYDLPLKPLHHDEGVNGLFLTNLVRPPHTYEYDPANYHGPTLYYFGWLSAAVLGLTTVAMRAVTAVAGLLAVVLVLPLRDRIGPVGAIAASVLLALSPGAVYFSRYFIHEMLLVCFGIALVVASVKWWHDGRSVWLYAAAASAGLIFATKETSIIAAVVWMGAAVGAAVLCEARRLARETTAGQPVFRSIVRGIRASVRDAAVRLSQRRSLVLFGQAAAVFVAVTLLFYTSLFTHWQGAIDAARSFAIWTKTGTAMHARPWHAYLGWLWVAESPLLILGGAGALWALWKLENRFVVFAALWALGILTAYSVIPYKTPWLTLNIIAPLAIVGGYGFDLFWRRASALLRIVRAAVALAFMALATYQTVALNFVYYDDERYPYVYVHTSRETLALVREIGRLEELNPGASIAVTSRDQFPLSWYLRGYPAGYYGRATVTNDPIVIASEQQVSTLDPALGDRYDRAGRYRLRPGVQLVLYVRRDLKRPRPGSADTSANPR